MKKISWLILTCIAMEVNGQIIFDPTQVHDNPGEFYHHEHIYQLNLTFYDANYHSTLKAWKENYLENTLPAKLDYGSIHFDSVAVKYKGNSTFFVPNSFNNPKLPYNIDINEYVGGQDIEGNKKLKLGNAWFDPTFAKEITAAFIYKQYLPTYEANLIKLNVNGNYLGVYVNQEDVSAPFLKKHFGEKDGAFFKCEPLTEEQAGHPVDWPNLLWEGTDTLNYYESYERKSDTGWTEFLHMIDVLNNNPVNIPDVLNVDRVLWNFAVTQVLSNEDTYNTTIIHNYYMYRTSDGKFQMIPWDLTESFCGILFSGGDAQSHYELDPLYGLSPYFADRPLVFQILDDPYYRKRYFAHIRTIIDEYYSYSSIENWVLALHDVAQTDVAADPNKPHNMMKFANNVYDPVNYLIFYTISGIMDVVENRRPYLLNYLDMTYTPPSITNVTQNIQHPSSSETVYVSAAVSNATSVKLRATNDPAPYASDFPAIVMLDNGLNGDAAAGDGIYTAAIPFTTSNDHVKYYIEAENDDAMMLSPERAEYFYYHYYVDQVVGEPELATADFSVYPNPASDWLNIEPLQNNDAYSVNMYDLAGNIIFTEDQLSGKTTVDVSTFSRGIYLLEMLSGTNRKTVKITLQ